MNFGHSVSSGGKFMHYSELLFLPPIAPRYHAKTGECSIYSCLAQFTAPELLTGQNKWACEKCTRLHQAGINVSLFVSKNKKTQEIPPNI